VSDAADPDHGEPDTAERTVPRSSVDAEWTDWFPFDPYPQQVDVPRPTVAVCKGTCRRKPKRR